MKKLLLIFIASCIGLTAQDNTPSRDEIKQGLSGLLAHVKALSPEQRVCQFEVPGLATTYFQNDNEIRSFAEKVAKCSSEQTAEDVYQNAKAQRPTKLSTAFQREYNEGFKNFLNLINQYCTATTEIEKNNIQEKLVDSTLSPFHISTKTSTETTATEKKVTLQATVSRHGKIIEEVKDSWIEPIA